MMKRKGKLLGTIHFYKDRHGYFYDDTKIFKYDDIPHVRSALIDIIHSWGTITKV